MKFKIMATLAFALSAFVQIGFAAPVADESGSKPWSITPHFSVFDSLKLDVKKSPLPENAEAFKAYVEALQFKELLQASENPLPTVPTSAGIFDGSQVKDSLSADDQLIFLYRNLGDRKAEAGVLSSLGTKSAINGNMEKAIGYFKDALAMNIEIDNQAGITKNYFSLARLYAYQGDFDEAVKFNQNIIYLAQQTRNNRFLAEAYMNLANIWRTQKRYKEAESMIMSKALPLNYYKLQDKIGTMKCYDQLAEIYQDQKRFSEAKWFFIQSNMVARKINNPNGIVNSLVKLAHVKMSIGDHQLALRDMREAEQLSISNKYRYKLVEIKSDLSRVYTMIGDKNAATSALSEFTVLKDALLGNSAQK